MNTSTRVPAPADLAASLRAALAREADAARAAAMAAYMRNRFAFFGIATPLRRAAIRPIFASLGARPPAANLLATARLLWEFPERECQYVACDLLGRHVRCLAADNLSDLAALITERSWWDTVDPLAAKVVGPLVAAWPVLCTEVDSWAVASNIWLRRTAIIHALDYKAATDSRRLAQLLDLNLAERDFFIRKAIGWALRQYARTDPDWVRRYVAERGARLSPLSRREACKHLGPA